MSKNEIELDIDKEMYMKILFLSEKENKTPDQILEELLQFATMKIRENPELEKELFQEQEQEHG